MLLSDLRRELDELRAGWQDSAADRYLNDFAAPMEDLLRRFTDRLAQADERLGMLYAGDDEP
jgi:hypothetical protein